MENQTNYEKMQRINETIKNKLIKRIEDLKYAKASKESALKSIVEENLHLMDIISIFTETRTKTITVDGIIYNVSDNENRTKKIEENNKTKEIYKRIIKQLDDCIKLCQENLDDIIARKNNLEEMNLINSMNQLFSVSEEEKIKTNELIRNIEDKISKTEAEIEAKKQLKSEQEEERHKTKKEYIELNNEKKIVEDEEIQKQLKIQKRMKTFWIKYLVIMIVLTILKYSGLFPTVSIFIWLTCVITIIEATTISIKSNEIISSFCAKLQKGSYYTSLIEEMDRVLEKSCQQTMAMDIINDEIEDLEQKVEEYKYLKLSLIDFQNGTNIANILYPELSQESEIENDLGISRKREISIKNNAD